MSEQKFPPLGESTQRPPFRVPPKPVRKCEGCGEQLDYEVNPEFQDGISSFGHIAMLYWKSVGHEECKIRVRDLRAKQEADEAKRKEEERMNARLNASGIPFRNVRRFTWDDLQVDANNKLAVDALAAWEGQAYGLFLYGPPGSGKSHLVTAWAVGEIRNGRQVVFRDVPTLMSELRAAQFDSQNCLKYEQLMDALRKAPVLVLDDIGAQKATEWVVEQLYLIINHRLNHQLPTFFTSNCAEEDLPVTLHERIYSRLKEMCVFIPLTGKDHRDAHNVDIGKDLRKRIKDSRSKQKAEGAKTS